MKKLFKNVLHTKRLIEGTSTEVPAIVLNQKDNMYYLASVENGYVRELHKLSKSKTPNEICRMDWQKMYKQISETAVSENIETRDFKIISDPRILCKV